MDVARLKNLNARSRALIATAVLLDGQDAAAYLAHDHERSQVFEELTHGILKLDLELRFQLMATILREAVDELQEKGV